MQAFSRTAITKEEIANQIGIIHELLNEKTNENFYDNAISVLSFFANLDEEICSKERKVYIDGLIRDIHNEKNRGKRKQYKFNPMFTSDLKTTLNTIQQKYYAFLSKPVSANALNTPSEKKSSRFFNSEGKPTFPTSGESQHRIT